MLLARSSRRTFDPITLPVTEWRGRRSFYLEPSVSQHEAKARFGEWLADIETRIGKLRAARQQAPEPLTRQNAYALAGRWYAWFIARHEKDNRTPGYWKSLGEMLMWDLIRPHAPEEYER